MLCSSLTAIDSKRLIRFPPYLKFKQNGEQDVPVPNVVVRGQRVLFQRIHFQNPMSVEA